MQATAEPKPAAARRPRQRRLPRTTLDVAAFLDFMLEQGADTPSKIARELGTDEGVISRIKSTGGQISIHFAGAFWAKYPDAPMDSILNIPGRPRCAGASR